MAIIKRSDTARTTPFSGQFRRQCMHFGNSAGNLGGSAVRRPVAHDAAVAMSKLVALLPNYMQIVQNWSENGVIPQCAMCIELSHSRSLEPMRTARPSPPLRYSEPCRAVRAHPSPSLYLCLPAGDADIGRLQSGVVGTSSTTYRS